MNKSKPLKVVFYSSVLLVIALSLVIILEVMYESGVLAWTM
ncbi:hypothetical protein YerA41_028 [Yersinia phage YerA41]|nr:hypothetical protein YerA41_028 [Yersinia phage YerA41]